MPSSHQSPYDLPINKNGTWPTGLNMLLNVLNEYQTFTLQFPQCTTVIHLKMVWQRKDMEWALQQINSWMQVRGLDENLGLCTTTKTIAQAIKRGKESG
jgi:hypothetical protein